MALGSLCHRADNLSVPPLSATRRAVSWAVLVAGCVMVIASIIEAFTADPQQGEGWIGGPIQAVFAGGPLVAVGFGLRSGRRTAARKTAIASLLLALVVGFVLVMQLVDPNETSSDRLLNAAAIVVYLAALVVEIPSFTSQWPPDDTPRGVHTGQPRAW
jgi:peptidoglycan/LPS O-acetylase OafA/YrhL